MENQNQNLMLVPSMEISEKKIDSIKNLEPQVSRKAEYWDYKVMKELGHCVLDSVGKFTYDEKDGPQDTVFFYFIPEDAKTNKDLQYFMCSATILFAELSKLETGTYFWVEFVGEKPAKKGSISNFKWGYLG